MTFTTTIKVPADKINFLSSVLQNPCSDLERDDIIWEGDSRFPNEEWALYQVISTLDPEQESCWSQCVLFDKNGHEFACSEVSETLLGTFKFDVKGKTYIVNIVEG
jgi:hypothetical protein